MGVRLPKLPPKGLARPGRVGGVVRMRPPRFARRAVYQPGFNLSKAQRTAVVVVTCAVVLLAWDARVLLPLRLLVIAFHEIGHAIVALLSGGEVVVIGVGTDESGFTLTRGGDRVAILNGGYLGSIITGISLLLSVRTASGARSAAGILGGILSVVAVRFHGADPVGLSMVLVSAVCLLGLATRSADWLVEVVVRCLGWFSLLYALIDIREDVFGAGGPDVRSDAASLEALTGIAAPVWGMTWMLVGIGLLWFMRRRLR